MKKNNIRFISVWVAAITAMPFIGGVSGGIYIWLSPNITLASVIALRSIVLLNLPGVAVLLLCLYRKRFFCNYLCPTGWCCQRVSKKAIRKPLRRVPANIGKYLALFTLTTAIFGYPLLLWLDPLAIFSSFWMIFRFSELSILILISLSGLAVLLFSQWLFPHSWCNKLCPTGGLQDLLWILRTFFYNDTKIKEGRHSGITRRELLVACSGLISGGCLSMIRMRTSEKEMLPPASLQSPQFETLCLRCGNCIRVCPTDIIRRNTSPSDWYAWMTPKIDLSESYCLSDCTLCGNVCPSGAISPFEVSAKKILPIGLAEIDTDKCLLQIPEECDRCKSVCAYNAIRITSDNGHIALPEIDRNRCVGCGACMHICPTEVIRIVKRLEFY